MKRLVLIVSVGLSAGCIRQSTIANLASMVTARTLNVTKRLMVVLQSAVIGVEVWNLASQAFRSLSTAPIRNMILTTVVALDGINYA